MKTKKNFLILMLISAVTLFLSACSAQNGQSNDGFFHKYAVEPFASLIHGTAAIFHDNYGVAIIIITLAIRLLLMPLMLKQYKNQRHMKEKMDFLKPEMDEIQKKLKATKDQKEQQKLQQEMMGLYRKHGVNPLNMGCLPMLIQMPILMGFYYAIRGSAEIASHSFLWFNLGHSDIWITALAGIVYYFQFKVSQATMPIQQQQQMKFMGLLSPIMIVMVSLNAPAALPLYWTVGGIFLTIQTIIGKKLYPTTSTVMEKTAQPISEK
ncbi:membrane protein insertase YidC [Cytobacillus depressus]|uniref:Membrane protein insertase YidC n=1 Tax=Cytobacillus depressus TaxID=1602942 RepID=A0A6L3V2D5_9BACI|nr:membrane protein insertase YidC [Cytobacillus depressus]KAB2330231.1 membrane protein insertase YidC [Cytobacillus depressus]